MQYTIRNQHDTKYIDTDQDDTKYIDTELSREVKGLYPNLQNYLSLNPKYCTQWSGVEFVPKVLIVPKMCQRNVTSCATNSFFFFFANSFSKKSRSF